MTTNYAKIASFMNQSPLSDQERSDLLAFLGQADDAALEPIAAVLERNPAWISVLSENYHAKKTALENLDQKAWANILQKERAELEQTPQE